MNKISYWAFQKNDEDELYPMSIASCPVIGDVTEIRFLDRDNFVASSSSGTVKVLKIQDSPYPELKEQTVWNSIHYFR